MWDAKKKDGDNGKVLERANSTIDLGVIIWDIAHHYVLTNTTAMASWVKYKMNPSWHMLSSYKQELIGLIELQPSYKMLCTWTIVVWEGPNKGTSFVLLQNKL